MVKNFLLGLSEVSAMSQRSPLSFKRCVWVACLIVGPLISNSLVIAQNNRNGAAMLTVDRIFGSDEFAEDQVGVWVWSKKTDAYFTLVKPDVVNGTGDSVAGDAHARDLVKVDVVSGETMVVVPANEFIPQGTSTPLDVEGFEFSADESKLLVFTNSKRVWRSNTRGDYWVLDLASKTLEKLGGDAEPSTLMFAKFSPDSSRVAYVCEKNIYVQTSDDLTITQVTSDGSTHLINGTSDWVNEEELSLRDAYRWSPDGKYIAFWQFDTTDVEQFHLIDNTRGTYPHITSFPYPKVGHMNSSTRLGVTSSSGEGETVWLDVPGDSREHYLPQMEWAPNGQHLLLQQMNRLQNTNRVMLADPVTGSTREVFRETESTWLENDNPVRWIEDGIGFVWLSERDGWQHAYRVSDDGQQLSKITNGDFDVIQLESIDQTDQWVYFSASPDNPTQRYLYRAHLDGTSMERLSPADQPGSHTYNISPNAKWALHTYSTFSSPPMIELIRLSDHRVLRVLHDNSKIRENLAKLDLPSSEFFRVDIGDGLELDAWCLKPPGFDAARKYPLLFHVYGEPHGQTVRDGWQGIRGLWHWMFAQQGYIVVSVDNRGTRSPRGRDWRKCVYQKIGIIAPVEQAAATRALLDKWSFADPGRIGIWGWSGGGSMSLNAILRYPKLYTTAIAVAPNADQLLYDTIYQERYMGLPGDNAEGYRLGSPITYASGLEGNLLVIHGTGDDNGHFQGTESLMNEFIADNKQFSVMPYPARSHAINEGRNTVIHFYSLMTNYFNEHLPVTPNAD